jgi:hypothetical protein
VSIESTYWVDNEEINWVSTNFNKIEVGLNEVIPRELQVSVVRIIMVSPKSTSVFGKKKHVYALLPQDSLGLYT